MRNPRKFICSLAWVSGALSLAAGCTSHPSPRRDDLVVAPLNLDDDRLRLGHEVFVNNCNICHPGGAAGVGPALNNKGFVPRALIKFQVRQGVGAMLKFSKHRISDEELDALVRYLKALQAERPVIASR